MSFDAKEISTRDGNPLELLKFSIGDDYVYRYTNAVESLTYLAEVYEARFLMRSNIQQSDEIEQSKLTVTVDRESPIAALFATSNVARKMDVQLWRYHKDDAEIVTYWQGTVVAVTRSLSTADITCEAPETELERNSLRQFFQPTCRFFLADGRCPVPRAAIKVTGNISSVNVSAFQITAGEFASKPDGYFKFGDVGLGNDIRFCVDHVGDTLTLLSNFARSPLGLDVDAFAGCDNLPATCKDKFGDYTEDGEAFGGFYVSIENYFEKGIR